MKRDPSTAFHFAWDDSVREEGFADDEESRRKGSIGIVMNAAIPLCDALRASPLGMTAEEGAGFMSELKLRPQVGTQACG